MERIDKVNDDISLIQKTEGLTFGTDALLLAGYVSGKYRHGCEFGGGSGIITMLLLSRGKIEKAVALEVQEEYYELMKRNAELNNLEDRMLPLLSDLREYRPEEAFDIIYTNPPYMKADSGKSNLLRKKAIARHEIKGDISDFCRAAGKMLRFGGTFAAVYRPDRLTDIISAMRNAGLEPKRMTLVYADAHSEPSMMLVEGKNGGKSGLIVTKPLIIYKDGTHSEYGEDMNYIMENGSFPAEYKR